MLNSDDRRNSPADADAVLADTFDAANGGNKYSEHTMRQDGQITSEGPAEDRVVGLMDQPDFGAPIVSVVVPIYNVAVYLRECLDSVLASTLSELQVICVDDGSTDGSGEIADEYVQRDHRVCAIHKDNAGYGAAVNDGMALALGDFVAIVESDDRIRPGMFATLVAKANEFNLDFVKADFFRFTGAPGHETLFYEEVSKRRDYYDIVLEPGDSIDLWKFANTWAGVYRRTFLEQFEIRHQESPGASFQDNGFWFQTHALARRFMYVPLPFYMNRRDRLGSSVYDRTLDKALCINSEYAYIRRRLEKFSAVFDKLEGVFFRKQFDACFHNLLRLPPDERSSYLDILRAEFQGYMDSGLLNRLYFPEETGRRLSEVLNDDDGILETVAYRSVQFFMTDNRRSDDVCIAFICDSGYVVPTAVALMSLAKYKARDERSYDVRVFLWGVSDADIRYLAHFARADVIISFSFLSRPPSEYAEACTDYGVSSTALYKFLLPQLIADRDKVLYIDGDVLIRADVRSIFDVDMGDHLAAVVRDYPQVLYAEQTFGVEHGMGYFNSGVMVLNLDKMRAERISDRLIAAKQLSDSPLQDQDIFNDVLAGQVTYMPLKCSVSVLNLYRSAHRYDLMRLNELNETAYNDLTEVVDDAIIVHFNSPDKPWKYYDVPLADIWAFGFAACFPGYRLQRCSLADKRGNTPNAAIGHNDNNDARLIVVLYDGPSRAAMVDANLALLQEYSQGLKVYIFGHGKMRSTLRTLLRSTALQLSVAYVDMSRLTTISRRLAGENRSVLDVVRAAVPNVCSDADLVMFVDEVFLRDDPRPLLRDGLRGLALAFLASAERSTGTTRSPLLVFDVGLYSRLVWKTEPVLERPHYADAVRHIRRVEKVCKSVVGAVLPKCVDTAEWQIRRLASMNHGLLDGGHSSEKAPAWASRKFTIMARIGDRIQLPWSESITEVTNGHVVWLRDGEDLDTQKQTYYDVTATDVGSRVQVEIRSEGLTVAQGPSWIVSFDDVNPTSQQFQAAAWAIKNGCFGDLVIDGSFNPTNAITVDDCRLVLDRFLSGLLMIPEGQLIKESLVSPTRKPTSLGLTADVFIDATAAGQSMTRGSMAALIWSAWGEPSRGAPENEPFLDVPFSRQDFSAIQWLFESKIIGGTKTSKGRVFHPDGLANRYHLAAMLMKLWKAFKSGQIRPPIEAYIHTRQQVFPPEV
jgi:lipopolysaccharide biosynthesis glycosyltransferase